MGEVADWLMREWGWHEEIARALERTLGYCEYCHEDLLASRPGYSSIVLDHLIPVNFKEKNLVSANFVLSCSSCNQMKHGFNPIKEGEDADQMVLNNREDLVQRVRERLEQKIEGRTEEWKKIKERVRS